MKNREKYREVIVKCARTTEMKANVCEFIRINVLPHFGTETCLSVNCAWCKLLVELWLDEEYEEPPKHKVDWKNVPVNTLVRVRDSENEKWNLRYFIEAYETLCYPYKTWKNGTTSKTANGQFELWRYCELLEDEDDGK